MSDTLTNDLFLRACRREPTPRTPIWIMRQAGRYLPDYQAVRANADFLTMVRSPELTARVTVQPVDILGVDAAILFSDIMVIPEAMGMELEMVESRGPVLHDPLRSRAQIDALKTPDPTSELGYVLEGVRACKSALEGRVPLIGFAGSPWTLLTYMVEGSGSKNFRYPKAMTYESPELAHRLLDRISDAVADFLAAQIEAGVNAVQIFDTWGGILTPSRYEEFSLKYMARIVERLKSYRVPVIVFSKDCAHGLGAIAASGCDVVGVDWRTDMAMAKSVVGSSVALQGNLDPALLYADQATIRAGVIEVLEKFGNGPGHVFNLGHGIWPDAPVENVKYLVEVLAKESPRFHQGSTRV